jgi:hypothetical protein
MYFTLFVFVIFFASVIFCAGKGSLWDNLLTWVNCILAGLIATNFFEPAADYLTKNVSKDYSWYWDLLAFWLIFAFVVGILRLITDNVSKVRVRFRKPVEVAGNIIFAILIGWQMVMYTVFSLHMAPLEVKAFDGGFQAKADPEAGNFYFNPDLVWLGFAHKQSGESGAMSRDNEHQFDRRGVYRWKYGLRRFKFENLKGGAGSVPAEG